MIGTLLLLVMAQAKIYVDFKPIIFLTLFCVCLIYALNLEDPDNLKHQIVVNGYMIPLLYAILFGNIYQKIGEEKFLRYYIYVALLFFVLTVIYKIQLGLFDRSVRYFLNGPIVFGWMSAISVLITLRYNQIRFAKSNYFLMGVFLFGVVWSLSKGPLLVLITCLMIFNSSRLLKIGFVFCVPLIVSYRFFLSGFDFKHNRTVDFFLSLFSDTGWQFIQSQERFKMLEYSSQLLDGNYLTGIGVSGFEYKTFYYPHNFIFNILMDGGLILFFPFMLLTSYIYLKTNRLGKHLLMFGMGALLFSGNTTYLRFIFLLPLIFITDRMQKSETKDRDDRTCSLL